MSEPLRCPHCSGKLTSFVRRDDELDRVREATIRDARVIALENQLAGAVAALEQFADPLAWPPSLRDRSYVVHMRDEMLKAGRSG